MTEAPPPPIDTSINKPELSPRRQMEVAQLSTALIKRKVKETQQGLREKSKEAQGQYFTDNPSEAVLQVMDVMVNPSVENYEWKNNSGEPTPAIIPGKSAERVLPKGAIAGHETEGRRATISHIKSIKGDSVVCMIEVKGDAGQVAIPSCEFSISRGELFSALLQANQEGIVGLFPDEQRQAIQEHLNLLQGTSKLTDVGATTLIETVAQEAGFITKQQWQSYLEKALPATKAEPVAPTEDVSTEEQQTYEKDKQAWEDIKNVRERVLTDFENRCQDQILLDPNVIVDILRAQIDPEEKSNLHKQRVEVQQEIEHYQQELQSLKEAKRTGKREIIEDIEGKKIKRTIDIPDKSQLEEEIKELEIRLEFTKKYQAAIDTFTLESSSSQEHLEAYFDKLQQGEIEAATAKEISSLISSGNIEEIIHTIEQQVLNQLGKTREDLNKQQNSQIQEALKWLEQIKKLKNTGKIAGIGLAAFLLIMVMQGMGGGGGGQAG